MELGPLSAAVDDAVSEAMEAVPRIWARDHTVWAPQPTEIADRLGWLDAPQRTADGADRLRLAADAVVADGVTDVLLIGMGGSSLYPEVLTTTIGPARGRPRLHVLDSTDPGAVLAMEERLPWNATLLVPASKSGTTIEMVSLLARFQARLRAAHGQRAGAYITPITDPGTHLARRALDEGFRLVVEGDPDVGGRFSALTGFGMWPAALLGMDLAAHLAPARSRLQEARSTDPGVNSPAVLGAVLAAAVRAGRDKLTLLLPESVSGLGAWIEQLVAESTGKQGLGLLPVVGEDPAHTTFGADRLVVCLGRREECTELVRSGVPVVDLPWSGPGQLAGEVVRWEFATAVAGALLGINPFDQPDVAAAKQATSRVLASGGEVPAVASPAPALAELEPGDFVALLAYVTPGGADHDEVEAAATRLRSTTGVAVTVGIGPRYLHSTGQFHKGGPNRGVFLVVVGDDPRDADIPGEELTFSRLKRAQAAGDVQALRDAGRRVTVISMESVRQLGA